MDQRNLKAITRDGHPIFKTEGPRLVVSNITKVTPPKPRLLDRVREAILTRHYSPRTEETYVGWIKRFIFFH
ncbi:MAG: phage integrase N-terminal SAM-like domain-containing protein, partial [Candidatus Binatia bacterium]